MDCRASLVLGLGLLAGCVGCAHEIHTAVATTDLKADVRVNKEPEEAPRQPQAATCIAFGTFAEKSAGEETCTPAARDRLRDQARKAYQQAMRIDPNNLQAQVALARLYATMGDPARAVATYRKALEGHPKEGSLWQELGMCYARTKEWEPAIESLQRAVSIDPEERSYTRALGYCLARAGRYDESFTAFARVEGEATAHYNVARMLHHMEQESLARQHLQMALAVNANLEPARELLAELTSQKASTVPVSLKTPEPAR